MEQFASEVKMRETAVISAIVTFVEALVAEISEIGITETIGIIAVQIDLIIVETVEIALVQMTSIVVALALVFFPLLHHCSS